MKRFIKYSLFALAFSLCTALFAGCSGCVWFPFVFVNSCKSCSNDRSSLWALRGADWISFSDEENRLGFRITDGNYFGGYGYITVEGESTRAFFDINGYYGKIDVYLVDDITNNNPLFIFEAEYVNKNGKQGIKIESTVRSASGDDYTDVYLNMTKVTDKSQIKPYEYFVTFTDTDGNLRVRGDESSNLFTTRLYGYATVVTEGRDREVEIEIFFRDDFTFVIYDLTSMSSVLVDAENKPVVYGTYERIEEKTYSLYIIEDRLFTTEVAREQFSAYPYITLCA